MRDIVTMLTNAPRLSVLSVENLNIMIISPSKSQHTDNVQIDDIDNSRIGGCPHSF